ncbi:hypothetical protein Plhal304r1_c040g0117421 [Plasmopara halstedii]
MTKSRSDRSPKIRILGVCSTIVPISCGLLWQFSLTTFRSFLDMVCLLVWGHDRNSRSNFTGIRT